MHSEPNQRSTEELRKLRAYGKRIARASRRLLELRQVDAGSATEDEFEVVEARSNFDEQVSSPRVQELQVLELERIIREVLTFFANANNTGPFLSTGAAPQVGTAAGDFQLPPPLFPPSPSARTERDEDYDFEDYCEKVGKVKWRNARILELSAALEEARAGTLFQADHDVIPDNGLSEEEKEILKEIEQEEIHFQYAKRERDDAHLRCLQRGLDPEARLEKIRAQRASPPPSSLGDLPEVPVARLNIGQWLNRAGDDSGSPFITELSEQPKPTSKLRPSAPEFISLQANHPRQVGPSPPAALELQWSSTSPAMPPKRPRKKDRRRGGNKKKRPMTTLNRPEPNPHDT